MKKIIIFNLTTRSYFITIKEGRPIFSGEFRKASSFESKKAAETTIVDFILPNEIQQTDENERWNYGHVLTVLEVYV